ncbi:hypothetical protein ACL02U_03095 [Streptomyces sp. MS06]|uniref:hypothetical protein n=1 Tax=Streptomyces sp. MS06 TaxID=3385974 RepID=UPI00399F1B55
MDHVRASVWGPAEFVGPPPLRLLVEGLLTGTLGAGVIIGVAVGGAWNGAPVLADGEAGLVCALALAVHLTAVRAGRALIGIVLVLGVCLALHAPQSAAGVVLAQRGREQSVVVTSVQGGGAAAARPGRYFCSVADRDGVPLKVRIWRGCGQATRPGDALAVVYDPSGRVPPRGARAGVSLAGPLRDLAGWAAALVGGCTTAVVRSYRLTDPAVDRTRPAHGQRL